jgi:hypothetical protein
MGECLLPLFLAQSSQKIMVYLDKMWFDKQHRIFAIIG